jgi:hypothetical protein
MAYHFSIYLRDQRNRQRTGITQSADDELFGMITDCKRLEGDNSDP